MEDAADQESGTKWGRLRGELLADLEQWARLTSKLTAKGSGTAR